MNIMDPRFDGAGPDQLWRDGLAQGKFRIQSCSACGMSQFPPSLVCRHCGVSDPAFVDARGCGTVYSTTTIRRRDGNYNVSLIELQEGARMMSRVEGDPERVRIGMPVVARIATDEQGAPFIVFDPSEKSL